MTRLRILLLLLCLLPQAIRAAEKNLLALTVTWNNPFNPARGEETRFEYVVRGQDRAVRLLVFATDGHLVRELADHLAAADTAYVQPWDGRNAYGAVVDSGLYFVVLQADDTRKVVRVVVRRS